MKIIDVVQGTDEWKQARAGKVTASCISDVLAKIKTDEAATRRDYKFQIVSEILTGKPQDSYFENDEMRWGKEQEPFARAAYEVQTNALVTQVGLVIHPRIEGAACSPDGLVGEDGGLEIKCPKTSTHLNTVMDGNIPSKHLNQMFFNMACTGAAWWDFVSFDPRVPAPLQLFRMRLMRDDERISAIESEVEQFLAEIYMLIAELKTKGGF